VLGQLLDESILLLSLVLELLEVSGLLRGGILEPLEDGIKLLIALALPFFGRVILESEYCSGPSLLGGPLGAHEMCGNAAIQLDLLVRTGLRLHFVGFEAIPLVLELVWDQIVGQLK
jgi:hypothetical protein